MNFPPIILKYPVRWCPAYGPDASPAQRQNVSEGWKATFILIHVIALKMSMFLLVVLLLLSEDDHTF